MSDNKTAACEACDGSGLVDPMLSASDPANGPCETCGGSGQMQSQTTHQATLPPFDIRPGERYTDANGRTWELTDHGQWKECRMPTPMADNQAISPSAWDCPTPYTCMALAEIEGVRAENRALRRVAKAARAYLDAEVEAARASNKLNREE